jgi:hypothetical protein
MPGAGADEMCVRQLRSAGGHGRGIRGLAVGGEVEPARLAAAAAALAQRLRKHDAEHLGDAEGSGCECRERCRRLALRGLLRIEASVPRICGNRAGGLLLADHIPARTGQCGRPADPRACHRGVARRALLAPRAGSPPR